MRIAILAVAAATSAIVGCAAPGTPGSGTGAAYTPIVDTAGVNMHQYQADLAQCRDYARQIDVGAASTEGMIVGVIAGALVGAAVGGNRRFVDRQASLGAIRGANRGAAAATGKQYDVLLNCMIGRGYRPLEVQPAVVIAPAPPVPQTSAVAVAPPAVPAEMPQPVYQPLGPPGAAAPVQAVALAEPAAPQARVAAGKWSADVVALQQVRACAAEPRPVLTDYAAGVELYSVACAPYGAMNVRCEQGRCRVAR